MIWMDGVTQCQRDLLGIAVRGEEQWWRSRKRGAGQGGGGGTGTGKQASDRVRID